MTSLCGAARAGDGGALLVAAEIDAGLGLEAKDVRAAIGSELHRPVAAPSAAPGVDAADVLLVSMTRARTVVSFHAGIDERAARSIPTPADRAGRLRAVAWLAGNLARDQVSPLVLAAITDPPSPATPSAPAMDAQPPSPTAPPSTVPPPVAPEATLHREAAPVQGAPAESTWTVSVTGGPAVTWFGSGPLAGSDGSDPFWSATSWHVAAQRRMEGGWLLGAALDYGPSPLHHAGYALTAGMRQRWRGFSVEESIGLGLERKINRDVTSEVTLSSQAGESSRTTVTTSDATILYARAAVTLAHPMWRGWDLVESVGVHLGAFDPLSNPVIDAAIGVRLRLP